MGIIAWIIFGALAGWVAAKIAGTDDQQGCLTNIVVGVVGAFLAGAVYKLATDESWDFEFNVSSFIVAVIGSVAFLSILRAIVRR